jgi:hypothetical protein
MEEQVAPDMLEVRGRDQGMAVVEVVVLEEQDIQTLGILLVLEVLVLQIQYQEAL